MDVGSIDSLTSELVDEVAELGSQIVVISILPPCSPRSSRLLYRRLRERYPDVRVLVGYWSALPDERLERRFALDAKDKLVTSLGEGVAAVKSAAAGMRAGGEADSDAGDLAPNGQPQRELDTAANGTRVSPGR